MQYPPNTKQIQNKNNKKNILYNKRTAGGITIPYFKLTVELQSYSNKSSMVLTIKLIQDLCEKMGSHWATSSYHFSQRCQNIHNE